jgi:hypothetical protein
MNKLPHDKDWFSDSQKDKNCKKVTPDDFFIKGNQVFITDIFSTLGLVKSLPKGYYYFESYDNYDNTVFICKNDYLTFTYNVDWRLLIKVHEIKQLDI